jgi:hypothetical protein
MLWQGGKKVFGPYFKKIYKMKKDHPYHEDSMFKGAPLESFAKAEILRRNMT